MAAHTSAKWMRGSRNCLRTISFSTSSSVYVLPPAWTMGCFHAPWARSKPMPSAMFLIDPRSSYLLMSAIV